MTHNRVQVINADDAVDVLSGDRPYLLTYADVQRDDVIILVVIPEVGARAKITAGAFRVKHVQHHAAGGALDRAIVTLDLDDPEPMPEDADDVIKRALAAMGIETGPLPGPEPEPKPKPKPKPEPRQIVPAVIDTRVWESGDQWWCQIRDTANDYTGEVQGPYERQGKAEVAAERAANSWAGEIENSIAFHAANERTLADRAAQEAAYAAAVDAAPEW